MTQDLPQLNLTQLTTEMTTRINNNTPSDDASSSIYTSTTQGPRSSLWSSSLGQLCRPRPRASEDFLDYSTFASTAPTKINAKCPIRLVTTEDRHKYSNNRIRLAHYGSANEGALSEKYLLWILEHLGSGQHICQSVAQHPFQPLCRHSPI